MNNLALSETTPIDTIVYKLEGYDPEGGEVSFGLVQWFSNCVPRHFGVPSEN
jgi:hypothetical protein